MSIDIIERYLQELEAIKNYPQVKRDKGKLSQKIEKLKISLDTALKEVSSLESSKAKLDGVQMTLEEAKNALHEGIETLETNLTEKSEVIKQVGV